MTRFNVEKGRRGTSGCEVPFFPGFCCAILAEIITKEPLGTIIFVIVFVITTKIVPPEHFLCNVAATRLSLFAREHAKEFAL